MRMLGSAKLFYLTHRVPLTNVLSLSSDLILILDSDLFIQETNTAFLTYFKLEKGEIKDTQFAHSPLASHFSAQEMSCIERALDGEGGAREVRFDLLNDGRFFRMKCIPLAFDSGARAVGVILEDITEMKTYQHELEARVRERTAEVVRAKDFAENLISTANAMIIGLDPKGNVTIFNKAAEQVTGYSRSEILGKNWFETVVPKARFPEIREEFRRLSGRGVPDTTDRPILTKSGDIRYISWSNNNIVEEGSVVATISFGIDITDRKNAEEMVKKANKQVALLTSVTRHDIINQITSLKGYIGILKRQFTDEKVAGVLQKEDEIAEMILRQIVFTRDYQNVGAEPPRWINVRDILNKILQSVDRGSITVGVDTGDLEIYADPLIEKVFFNLIDNTLRHGGQVTRIGISCEEQEKDMILIYEDDGEGIPDEIKEKIFTRGFGKNTGYGLFLIREILSITGFSIHENGIQGRGARFIIHVPHASYRMPGQESTPVV